MLCLHLSPWCMRAPSHVGCSKRFVQKRPEWLVQTCQHAIGDLLDLEVYPRQEFPDILRHLRLWKNPCHIFILFLS